MIQNPLLVTMGGETDEVELQAILEATLMIPYEAINYVNTA